MHLPGNGCSGSMGQVHTEAGGGWGKVAAAGLWPGNAHEETIMSRHLEQPPSLPHSLPSLILTLFTIPLAPCMCFGRTVVCGCTPEVAIFLGE